MPKGGERTWSDKGVLVTHVSELEGLLREVDARSGRIRIAEKFNLKSMVRLPLSELAARRTCQVTVSIGACDV